jgi:adenosylcobinamide amidohydrolase
VITVTLDRPWLIAQLPRPMRMLSWAPHAPGYVTADQVVWREVKNADLPLDFDVESWFAAQMARYPGAVGMMTSRDIGTWGMEVAQVDGLTAACLCTLGLSNGESVGTRLPWHPAEYGTINLLVATDAALTDTAMLEAMSIAVQARTAGVMAAGVDIATGLATGTGTDCIVLACDPGETRYAGLHTAVGEVIGAAVRRAVTKAAADWVVWRDTELARRAGTP